MSQKKISSSLLLCSQWRPEMALLVDLFFSCFLVVMEIDFRKALNVKMNWCFYGWPLWGFLHVLLSLWECWTAAEEYGEIEKMDIHCFVWLSSGVSFSLASLLPLISLCRSYRPSHIYPDPREEGWLWSPLVWPCPPAQRCRADHDRWSFLWRHALLPSRTKSWRGRNFPVP